MKNFQKRVITLICTLCFGYNLSAQEIPAISSQSEGQAQTARSFLLAAVVIEAVKEYYQFYQQCPDNLASLEFPNIDKLHSMNNYRYKNLAITADSVLLAAIEINKQCEINLSLKNKEPVIEALRGKQVQIKLDMTQDTTKATCTFNGDQQFKPPANCQFPFSTRALLLQQDLLLAETLDSTYKNEGHLSRLISTAQNTFKNTFYYSDYIM